MSLSFISLPVSGPGPGTPVAVPVSEELKTFYAAGNWEAESVAIELSADGTNFSIAGQVPLGQFQPIDFEGTAAYARANVIGLVEGGGLPTCILGVDTVTGTQASASLTAPALPGAGDPVDVSGLPRIKTWFVAALDVSAGALAVVEVSHDGTNFVPLFRIDGALFTKGDTVVTDGFYEFARVTVLIGNGSGFVIGVLADPTCC